MKNKLYNKRFSKILVTMCMFLTMVFGSCMSVFAYSDKTDFGDGQPICSVDMYDTKNNENFHFSWGIKYIEYDSPVYSLVTIDNNNLVSLLLVSASSFCVYNHNSHISEGLSTSYRAPSSNFYVLTFFFGSEKQFLSSSTDFVGSYIYDGSSKWNGLRPLCNFILGLSSDLPDGSTIESGSSIPSNPEYDSGATATIAPPSGVTYYEYVDTSQSSAISPTVRKGQLQWNVPDDDSLYIEIYADLTYKEGLLNKKTQVVYPWKTLTNSGLKADTHKLLFDRFQAGTDYFVENGLDESAFSSHVVNGYYLRFCKINEDKSVSYSLWNKISIYRDNSLTQIGTASSETGIFDENGNWINKQIVNSEIVDGGGKLPAFSPGLDDEGNNLPSNNNGLDLDSFLTDSNIFERFIGYLKSAMSSLGELPQYVGQLFSFLPQEIIGLLGFGVIIAIILRIIGR